MANVNDEGIEFAGLIDLAHQQVGGRALLASDEFFAGKECLLQEGRGVFLPDEYTERGKWMDGWEPRRRRAPGHDWCIIELGIVGQVRAVNVDTNHFLGNHPPYASVDGCYAPGADAETLRDTVTWTPIVPSMALKAGSENVAIATTVGRWTHVRLNIYPAGGVARFRVWGDAEQDAEEGTIDLAGLGHGGIALCCSDMFFSPMNNLLKPQPAEHMGQGWETKRSRPPTDDWVIIKLGTPGDIETIIADTAFFKGNYPEHGRIDALYWPDAPPWALVRSEFWTPITEDMHFGPDRPHEMAVHTPGPWTHIRLWIVPDGGVSRLRVLGKPNGKAPGESDDLVTRINAMDDGEAAEAFRRCCGAERWVNAMVNARPFSSRTALFGEAERAWWHLGDGDWLAAFDHHPRIGASLDALREKFGATADLSAQEQAGAAQAPEEVLQALATANETYLETFGFIFIVCATGKTASEMLALLESRLPNERSFELRIAAGEQAKITRLRLEQL